MQSKFFSAFNAVLSSHLNTPEKCPKKAIAIAISVTRRIGRLINKWL